jgi:hypothetical protein
MHYECRNPHYQYRNNECPKFGRLVQKRTVIRRRHANCETCDVEMKAIEPTSKRDDSKVLRRASNTIGSGVKPTARKKVGGNKGPNKRWISKAF